MTAQEEDSMDEKVSRKKIGNGTVPLRYHSIGQIMRVRGRQDVQMFIGKIGPPPPPRGATKEIWGKKAVNQKQGELASKKFTKDQ